MNQNENAVACDRFLTEPDKQAQAKEQKKAEFDRRWDKIRAAALMVLCDGLMLAMIANGLIDNFIGMFFLIGISAYFGGELR